MATDVQIVYILYIGGVIHDVYATRPLAEKAKHTLHLAQGTKYIVEYPVIGRVA
jgi:hypothetical protein